MSKEAAVRAREVLSEMLRLMGVEAQVDVAEEEDLLALHVTSPEAPRLIGRNAHMLLSLQYLLNRMMRRLAEGAPFCQVDIENYREQRHAMMAERALAAAEEVRRTGTLYRFDPMNALDRRAVHRALDGAEGVFTESREEDREGMKVLIVRPVAAKAPPVDDDAPPSDDGPPAP